MRRRPREPAVSMSFTVLVNLTVSSIGEVPLFGAFAHPKRSQRTT